MWKVTRVTGKSRADRVSEGSWGRKVTCTFKGVREGLLRRWPLVEQRRGVAFQAGGALAQGSTGGRVPGNTCRDVG